MTTIPASIPRAKDAPPPMIEELEAEQTALEDLRERVQARIQDLEDVQIPAARAAHGKALEEHGGLRGELARLIDEQLAQMEAERPPNALPRARVWFSTGTGRPADLQHSRVQHHEEKVLKPAQVALTNMERRKAWLQGGLRDIGGQLGHVERELAKQRLAEQQRIEQPPRWTRKLASLTLRYLDG